MTVEVKGTIKELFNTKQVTETFAQKEVIVTIDENSKYPQHICIQANNDKIGALDNFKVGDAVIVRCNLNGREAKGRYFNSLTLWTITKDNNVEPF